MGVAAVIIGIVALLLALLATFLFGTVGGIIAAVAGAAAIVLAFLKRKQDGKGGIAGIVIGVIAIILAVSMIGTMSNLFKTLHSKALELKPDGLWAKVSEKTDGGMVGLLSNLPKDEASLDALIKEMDELNGMKVTVENGVAN